jgi:hypothetical protein
MYFTVDLHVIIPVDPKNFAAIGTGARESTRNRQRIRRQMSDRDWHRCCPFGDGYVMNVTALLLLLTLTGSPIASLGCISWCASPVSTDHAGCRETSPQGTSVAISDADNACALLFATSPFLREDGRTTPNPSSPMNAVRAFSPPRLEPVRFGDTRNVRESGGGRATRPLVLRI